MIKNYTLTALIYLFSIVAYAQCVPGEVEVEFVLSTDGYGYEVYWELLPSGNDCGDGALASGGNDLEVGCEGANQEDATAGNGYENNETYTVGPWCLTEGEFYDILFVDDYTDGGLTVEVYENGELTHLFNGAGDPTVWTFQAGFPTTPENDLPCGATLIEIDGQSLFLDNTEAIASGDEVSPNGGGCGTFGLWCEGNTTNTVWAQFVAPPTGSIEISTCNEGTEMDTQLALYLASDCGDFETFELVSSNDDAYGDCSVANVYASVMYASCLQPGQTYYIQLDGWDGDTGIAELSVSSYENPISLEAFVNNVDCPNVKGDDSGAITLLAFGTGIEYTAAWTGPDGYTGEGIYIDNLISGTYDVEISTACGETASGSFTVDVPPALQVNVTATNATCEGSTNGSINLVVSGASEPYDYSWSGPNGFNSGDQDPANLMPGSYSVQIIDDNDCQFQQNVNVGFDDDFQFSLGADVTICQNESFFMNGPAGYTYEWQDESENQFFVVQGWNYAPGTYPFVLTASNDLGCAYTDALFVTIDGCIGIEDLDEFNITAYPNPSDGLVYISGIQGFNEVGLDVIDASGRMVKRQSLSGINDQAKTDLSQLSPGIYLLHLDLDGMKRQIRIAIR